MIEAQLNHDGTKDHNPNHAKGLHVSPCSLHIASVPTGNAKVVKAYVLTAARNADLNLAAKKRIEADNILDLPLASNDDLFEQVAASEDYCLMMKAIKQNRPFTTSLSFCFHSLRQWKRSK